MTSAAGMNVLRATAILLSLLIHGTIGYSMLPSLQRADTEALDLGQGTDIVLVQQGIVAEGLSKGDDMETIETAEITPTAPTPPPPPKEVKPDELRDIIDSNASSVEQDVVKDEVPPETVKTPPIPQVQVKEQPQQVAVKTEQSSGKAAGGDAKAIGRYMSQINSRVQRSKLPARTRAQGTVVVSFTINVDGQLLSRAVATSSGSQALDEAATATLDRAAPFPPIPPEVSVKPLAFTQSFKFVTR
jgi:periplasmic protein TonB